MSIRERKFFYNEEKVNGNIELDYINHSFTNMNLRTVEHFRISELFEHRPDLISMQFYGSFHFGWLIAFHNDMIDPIMDFTKGKRIKIPELDSYFRYFKTHARSV